MESEKRISEAKRKIRNFNSRRERRGRRVHENVYEDNKDRLRALDGICGDCANFKLGFKHFDGKDRILLRCKKNNSPLQLYRDTPFGQLATCQDFTPRNEIPSDGVK